MIKGVTCLLLERLMSSSPHRARAHQGRRGLHVKTNSSQIRTQQNIQRTPNKYQSKNHRRGSADWRKSKELIEGGPSAGSGPENKLGEPES